MAGGDRAQIQPLRVECVDDRVQLILLSQHLIVGDLDVSPVATMVGDFTKRSPDWVPQDGDQLDAR